MLGAFLRGQFLVMLILGVLYGIGLWAVGLTRHPDRRARRLAHLRALPRPGHRGRVFGGIASLAQFGDWPHLPACSRCSASAR